MTESPAELLEIYRSWSDDEIVRRFRAGGLTEAAHEAMSRELKARGIPADLPQVAAAEESPLEIHTLDPESLGEDGEREMSEKLEGEPVNGGVTYYIDAATVELLGSEGASPKLVSMLRGILGESEGVEVLVPAPSDEDEVERIHNPHRFQIAEKIVTVFRRLEIVDETGHLAFVVKRDVGDVIGNDFTLEDLEGRALLRVEKKVLALYPRYRLLRDDIEVATVRWNMPNVECTATPPLEVEGTVGTVQFDFNIRRGGTLIGQTRFGSDPIRRGMLVDVLRGEDVALILGLVLALRFLGEDDDKAFIAAVRS
jgi:uncharacterized protein YxjI